MREERGDREGERKRVLHYFVLATSAEAVQSHEGRLSNYMYNDTSLDLIRAFLKIFLIYMYLCPFVIGSGKIQHFADFIKIEILLYLASLMSELQVC